MMVWFAHVVQIILVGFIGYCIALAVENKRISQMIVVVSVIIFLQVTIEDVSPVVNRVRNKVNSVQQSVDKVTKLNPF